jgi:hypothetical protein
VRRFSAEQPGTDRSGSDDAKSADQDAEAERTRKLAKVLTQTENPAVLKTVSSVLSGLQGMFGGGKKAARKPDSGSSDKPGK